MDNININIRGATCISDAVLQQQQKGPRQDYQFRFSHTALPRQTKTKQKIGDKKFFES